MAYIKSKSKYDDSQCSLEDANGRCHIHIKKDDEYIYDTEAKKAYCTTHESINSKVQEKKSGGGSGFKSYGTPQRTPEDMVQIHGQWIKIVLPSIIESWKTVEEPIGSAGNLSFKDWLKMNQEIYLDRFDVSKGSKNGS